MSKYFFKYFFRLIGWQIVGKFPKDIPKTISIVESAIKYWGASKLYIWKKLQKKPEANTSVENTKDVDGMLVPKLSDSRLKDLTWSLDINETIYSKEAKKLTTRT